MTETMWTVLLLLGKLLLAWLLTVESRDMVVAGGSLPNYHTVLLVAREELVAARRMKPFWTSTGLCPPEPRNASGAFLLSKDSLTNLELIASLPNRGISHVRIHWLLELLEVSLEQEQLHFNFTTLDVFLDHLRHVRLYPGFELMGIPRGNLAKEVWWRQPYAPKYWMELVKQLVGRYTDRYGVQYVSRWRFETWNEPDLRSYNLLNFTVNDYLSYVFAMRDGLHSMSRTVHAVRFGNVSPAENLFPLYGPAGLFKTFQHHPFCWSVIKVCSANITNDCPFDTITFHRKGSGRWASEVLNGGRQLLEDMLNSFPPIGRLKFANDEADPVAGWSTGRPFQADVRYAAMVFSIVTQHWSAITEGNELGRRLHFLSHDNAFLSYYPSVFDQRTLFARFQMNLTKPPHVQFIAKPAFSALGMLANLGPFAAPTQFLKGNVSYVLSADKHRKYVCLVASRSNDSFPMWVKRSYFNLTIPADMVRVDRSHTFHRISYLIEAIQDGWNDPFRLWQLQGKPPFPTAEQLAAMREIQLPSVLYAQSQAIEFGMVSKGREISLSLRGPWIVSVRLCSEDYPTPGRVRKVRVRTVYRDEVLIHWYLSMGKNQENRCIQTYEVWFKAKKCKKIAVAENGYKKIGKLQCNWCQINVSKHTPFMFYQYTSNVSFPARTHAACKQDSEEVLRPYKAFDVVVTEGKSLKLWMDNGQSALCNPVWYFNGRPVSKPHCNSNYGEFVCSAVTRNDAGRYDLWAGDGTRQGQKRLMFSANVQVMRDVTYDMYRASEPAAQISKVQEAEPLEEELQYQPWDDCFCSGVTNRCGMAPNLYWTRNNFTLTKAIPRTTTLLENETATDYLEIPSTVWSGNLITAYGGYLRFPVTDDCYTNRRKPCILLFDKRNRHRAIGYYLPPSHDQRQVQVLMKESSWSVVPTHEERGDRLPEDKIDKHIFMTTLSNIREIFIRGRYRARSVDNVLSIDMATWFNEGLGQVTTVEECDCHPGYGGLSCEVCEKGYYRVYESINSAGLCISYKERWMTHKRRYGFE